jgi:hypothetical protein
MSCFENGRGRAPGGGAGALLLLLVLAADGRATGLGAPIPAPIPGMPPPAAAAGPPWTPVHPERKQRLIGAPIGEVCFDGTAPRKLAGKPPDLPPSSAYRRLGGVLVAHCLVDDEGWVVEAQLWKVPDPADRQAMARALAGWRFAPARRHDGRPAAVHFTVTIPIARQPDGR